MEHFCVEKILKTPLNVKDLRPFKYIDYKLVIIPKQYLNGYEIINSLLELGLPMAIMVDYVFIHIKDLNCLKLIFETIKGRYQFKYLTDNNDYILITFNIPFWRECSRCNSKEYVTVKYTPELLGKVLETSLCKKCLEVVINQCDICLNFTKDQRDGGYCIYEAKVPCGYFKTARNKK